MCSDILEAPGSFLRGWGGHWHIHLNGGEELYRVSEEERKRRIEEQIGKTYGDLTIISFAEYRNHEMFFNCRCVCGTEKAIRLA